VSTNPKLVWTGRVIAVLAALVFLMSAFMKFQGGAEVMEGWLTWDCPRNLSGRSRFSKLRASWSTWFPVTSVLGAILLTGYLGGAICTHLRVGDPVVLHIVLGVLVWLGVYLREERLRRLLPLVTR